MKKPHLPARLETGFKLARATYESFSEHGATLAAATAFYTLMSLAPLVVVTVGVVAAILDENTARTRLLAVVRRETSPDIAATLERVLTAVQEPSTPWAAAMATLVSCWAAARFFTQVQDALNLIWGVRVRRGLSAVSSVRQFLIKRALSLAMVIACGGLLLASLSLHAVLSSFGTLTARLFGSDGPPSLLVVLQERALSFFLLAGLFALIYRVLPDAVIRFRDVWPGALTTSALTLLGTWLLGLYLSRVAPAWLEGALGSIAAFVVWTYYMSQVFFLGATLTSVWAQERARGVRPEPHAELIPAG